MILTDRTFLAGNFLELTDRDLHAHFITDDNSGRLPEQCADGFLDK